jgi:DNA invertase Pin-like site-specific DNA recombinase
MKLRAVIYARYSTENQRDASIEDQMRICQRIVDAEGFELVTRFEDRGISGGTDQRPGYQALLTTARAKLFDIIVVEDISRLWRSRSEFGSRSAELEDIGIHLITAVGDDTRRNGWGLILGIKNAVAEALRKDISHKTRRGLEGKALAGLSTGGRCFGYSRNPDGSWSVSVAQATIIRDIFSWAAAGKPANYIAAHLNRAGVPAPRGGAWADSTIRAILRNRRYLGEVIYGANEVRSSARDSARRVRIRRPEPLSVRQAPELAIISQELFDKVQKVRAKSLAIRPWKADNFSALNQPGD